MNPFDERAWLKEACPELTEEQLRKLSLAANKSNRMALEIGQKRAGEDLTNLLRVALGYMGKRYPE